MHIAEIFHSLQGEGELTGMPSVFIRTSGCNLRCTWCDTKYASWNPEGTELPVAEIVRQVAAWPARHCVLTGGEPMIAKGIRELAGALHAAGRHITIETAGTVPPEAIACDLASLSPKLRNSTPAQGEIVEPWRERHEARRLQPEALRAWIERYPFQLKFVVENTRDLDEIDELLRALGPPVPPSKVLLMPQGVDPATLREREQWLIDVCLHRGFRYCKRLHIELFGNTRGT